MGILEDRKLSSQMELFVEIVMDLFRVDGGWRRKKEKWSEEGYSFKDMC